MGSCKSKHFDAVIIGGGVSGLTCAYELAKSGKSVIVLEKRKVLGGALRSYDAGSYFVEAFYHHVFSGDVNFFGLAEELGISDKVVWSYPLTAFYDKGVFHNLTKPPDILGFSMLSFLDKISLLRLMVALKFACDLSRLDKVPMKEWIVRNGSQGVYDRFFRPMLVSKYGSNLDEISAAWFVERMRLRASRGYKGECLGYVAGGFHEVVERLSKGIEEMGGVVETGVRVERILVDGCEAKGVLYDGKSVDASVVYSTIDPHELVKLSDFGDDFTSRVDNLECQGALCVLLGLKGKKLSDYYWSNIMDSDIPFGALIEHTNFQDFSQYGERVVYLASYPDKGSRLWRMPEGKVYGLYFGALKRMFPDLSEDDVCWWKVYRDEYAGLVYKLGSMRNMPDYNTPVTNLFVGGMFNSYPERSIELSVKKGMECAELMLGVLD